MHKETFLDLTRSRHLTLVPPGLALGKEYADVWIGWADWLGFASRAFVDARAFARTLNLDTRDKWIAYVATGDLPRDIPKWPQNVYKGIGWNSWEDWLGRQAGFRFRPFEQARTFARSLKLTSRRDWTAFVQSDKCPKDIPSSPAEAYPDQWSGYGDWLGKHTRWNQNAILAFLNSLRPLIQDLCPAEIFAILQWNGLIGKRFPTNRNAALLRSLETLCTSSSPEKAIEQFGSQLAQIAEEPDGTEDCANEDSSCELAPVTPDILSISTPLHCLRALSSLNSVDSLAATLFIDSEEILDFLVNNRVAARDLRRLEEVLLKRKLPWIMDQLQPGTILYTQFVTGIVEPLRQACKEKGYRVGLFTGDEKSGLKEFRDGHIDILIGSAPIGTGVDGLQGVSNRLIFVSLPWTSAEYEQVIGRLHRQGSRFDQVEVTIPQIILRNADGREWSWDKSRLERIQWKRTLADAAVDGVIPQGHLPSKEEMQIESLAALNKWIAQVGSKTPVSESRENDQDLIETPATINPAVL